MRAWKNRFPRKMLYEKYNRTIWGGNITFLSFLQAVYRHEDHKPLGVMIVPQEGKVGRDITGIAKMITELYSRKVDGMKPEDVTTKEYVAVNKLVLDEQKLSLDKNAQMLEFAKIFGIPEVPEPLQGEEVHDELRPPEVTGDKPENT